MILGIDVSTSITGYCILDLNDEIIKCGAWDTRNKNNYKNIYAKAEYIKEEICAIKAQYPIQKVFIEKPFMFFGSGGSSAKTMASLQRFNGVVSWICYEAFQMMPDHITAQQCRKLIGLQVPRGQNTKKEIVKWLLDKVPTFSVEYTKYGNPRPKYFDIADAVVVAKAGLVKLNDRKS